MEMNGGFLVTKIKQLGDRIFEKILSEKNIDAFNGAQGRILYVLISYPYSRCSKFRSWKPAHRWTSIYVISFEPPELFYIIHLFKKYANWNFQISLCK